MQQHFSFLHSPQRFLWCFFLDLQDSLLEEEESVQVLLEEELVQEVDEEELLSQGLQQGRDLTLESLPHNSERASEQQLELLEEQDGFKSKQARRLLRCSGTTTKRVLHEDEEEHEDEELLEQLLEEELELLEEEEELFLQPLHLLRPQEPHIMDESKMEMSLIQVKTNF